MNYRIWQAVLLRCLVALVLVACSSGISLGATLFERSLPQFRKNALHVSPGEYCFVVLGDSRNGDPVFKKALELARRYKPLFILHGGDYSERGTEEQTRHFRALVEEAVPDIPFFVVMGNHENRSVFLKQIGPLDFTLDSPRLGFRLVALDNSLEELKAAQLDYLRSHLSADTPTSFVAMHIPPKTDRWGWHTFTEGTEELGRILHHTKVQGALFSHVHLFDRSEFEGVPAVITGGAGAPLVTGGFPGDPVYHIVVVKVVNGKASFHKVLIPN